MSDFRGWPDPFPRIRQVEIGMSSAQVCSVCRSPSDVLLWGEDAEGEEVDGTEVAACAECVYRALRDA